MRSLVHVEVAHAGRGHQQVRITSRSFEDPQRGSVGVDREQPLERRFGVLLAAEISVDAAEQALLVGPSAPADVELVGLGRGDALESGARRPIERHQQGVVFGPG
jgi:hypothetical protein